LDGVLSLLLVLAAAGLASYILLVLGLVFMGRRAEARALAGFIPDCIVLFKRLLGDPRLPRSHRLLLGGLLVYLASPIDLVPDFIPIAGQLDDAVLVGLVIRLVLKAFPTSALVELWPGPVGSLDVVLRFAGRERPA
jgi:uncharacterized membrane protein YkvA (DUF1232 family)